MDQFILIHNAEYFIAIQEEPVTLLMTVDPADEIAHLHTCIPRKFYFMFGQDTFNADRNELSSDEDGENEDEESEELFRVALRRGHQRPSSSRALPHNSSTLMHPPTSPNTHSPTPLTDDPPTSLVLHTNPLQWGESLVELSVLPCCIWTKNFIPSPGRYDSLFTGHQPILDKVYELASSNSPYPATEMIVQARTVETLADELRASLERAAKKGDFTEVLSQQRSFQV